MVTLKKPEARLSVSVPLPDYGGEKEWRSTLDGRTYRTMPSQADEPLPVPRCAYTVEMFGEVTA